MPLAKLTIYLHLTKCAGRSFAQCLYGQFGDKMTSAGGYKEMEEGQRKRIRLMHGEFSMVDMAEFQSKYGKIVRPHQFITVLRHPVDQLLSYMYYWQATDRYPEGRASVLNHKFLEWAEWDNTQCRQLAGLRVGDSTHKERLEAAKKQLRGFAAIGLVERFEESVGSFNKLFGWRLPVPGKTEGKNHFRPLLSKEPQHIIAAVEEHQRWDLELYDYAVRLFNKQLRRKK